MGGPPSGARLIPGTRPPPAPPSGYAPTQGGLAPIPGGPADPSQRPPPAGYRPTPEGGLTQIPGGPDDPNRPGGPQDPNRDPGVDQARMAGFLRRAAAANNLYTRQNVGPRSLPGEIAREWFPNVTNYASSPERQQAEAAQNEFVAATLRYESGAAIPPAELEAQRRRYFPMPGDSPETIQLKAELRRTALNGLAMSAGPAAAAAIAVGEAEDVGAAIERARLSGAAAAPPAAPQGTPSDTPPGNPRLPPEQEAQIRAAIAQAQSPEQLQAAVRQITGGRGLDDPAGVLEQYRTTNTVGGFNYPEPPPPPPAPPEPNDGSDILSRASAALLAAGINPAMAVAALAGDDTSGAITRGGLDTLSLGTRDEIMGGARTLIEGGDRDQNIALERGIDAYDNENNFTARLAGQLAGGIALPFSRGAGLGRQTAEAAGYGAGYGFGSGEGNVLERAPGAAAGGGIGLVLPPVLQSAGRTANFLTRTLSRSRPTPEDAAIGRALSDEGIPGSRPIVDPTRRGDMAYLETTRGGNATVRAGLEDTRAGIERRVGELQGPGNVQTEGGMGQAIQNAGTRRLTALRRQGRSYFNAAAARGGDVPIQPSGMVAELDDNIARLSRNPNANRGTLSYLRSVRGDLVDDAGNLRPKTVADIRDIRTGVNDEINRRNLVRTRAEAIMESVNAAGRRDLERDLSTAAPDALRLYQQGDRIWSRMHTDRRQVVERLTGPADNPLSGDKVLANVTNMMRNRGDAARFDRVMDMMTARERQDFVATLIEPIGRGAADEPFSPAIFLRNTRSFQPGPLRRLFGPEAAQSIQNLRLAARGFRDTVGSLNNTRSGFVNNFKDIVSSITNLRSAGGGALGFAVAGLPGAVAGTMAAEGLQRGANYLSARALMNPDMSRWLARAASARTPSAVRNTVAALSTVASRNPAIAQDALGLQSLLMRAVNDNAPQMGRAAASPEEGPRNADQ